MKRKDDVMEVEDADDDRYTHLVTHSNLPQSRPAHHNHTNTPVLTPLRATCCLATRTAANSASHRARRAPLIIS